MSHSRKRENFDSYIIQLDEAIGIDFATSSSPAKTKTLNPGWPTAETPLMISWERMLPSIEVVVTVEYDALSHIFSKSASFKKPETINGLLIGGSCVSIPDSRASCS